MLLLGTFYTEREGPVVAAFFGYCEILLSASIFLYIFTRPVQPAASAVLVDRNVFLVAAWLLGVGQVSFAAISFQV